MSEGSRRILLADVAAITILVMGLGYVTGLLGGDAGAERSGMELNPPRPSCFVGGVSLGREAGAIDYWARCRPTAPSGDIGFTVSRTTPDESRFLPLKAFQRYPSLEGAGGERRARCVRVRRSSGQINCGGKVARWAVLKGRIWVAAKERCESDIQLVSAPSSEPCIGVCASVLPGTTVIASGPPRGC